MRAFFQIQQLRLHRYFRHLGIAPVPAYLLLGIMWLGGSLLFFERQPTAHWVYPLLFLLPLLSIQGSGHWEFFRQAMDRATFQRTRLLTSGLVGLPVAGMLLFQGHPLPALGYLGAALLIGGLPTIRISATTLPTPFGGHPFEFATGFRKTWPAYLVAYFLLFMTFRVDNGNLALAGTALLWLTYLAYYGLAEPQFYQWVFAGTAAQFLNQKMKTALLHAWTPLLPFLLWSLWQSNYFIWVLGISGLGSGLLLAQLLAKYKSYPGPITLGAALLLFASLLFPPLLLILLPMWRSAAIRQLNRPSYDTSR